MNKEITRDEYLKLIHTIKKQAQIIYDLQNKIEILNKLIDNKF